MFTHWLKDEEGQAMAEYGLLVALLVVAIVLTLAIFRDKIKDVFKKATDSLGTAGGF